MPDDPTATSPDVASGAPDRDLLAEMHRVGGGLFLAGGLIVAVVLLASRWDDLRPALLTVSTVVAITAGIVLLWMGRRGTHLLPLWVLEVLAVLGTLNITLAVVGGGITGSAALGVLYAFVTVFSFYYFPPRLATLEVVLSAIAYAVSLRVVGVADPLAQWLVVTAANVVIGALIGRTGQRVRGLLADERAASDRLRELDELRDAFLRTVSHEMRTPLTSVVGYAETLKVRRHELDDTQTGLCLARISQNADRLQRLLSNLLDIDRISRGVVQARRERVNVGHIVDGVVTDLRSPTHDIEVVVHGLPIANVEPGKVERIVENLVGNAVRHTPEGTAVRVAVTSDLAGGVLIVVEDDGPGIEQTVADQIFEPFVQGPTASTAASPGTGIGLALVARFAQLHGGSVHLTPSSRGGARFVVSLPGDSGELDLRDGTEVPQPSKAAAEPLSS